MNINKYKSTFVASSIGESVLRKGKIIDSHESAADMINRMVEELFNIERSAYKTQEYKLSALKKEFGRYLDRKDCVMSTPIMTNAGRYFEKPLSAVTVPPIDLKGDRLKIRELINSYHESAMGTGFNLDDTESPLETLNFINSVAVDGANSGREDRPVGNMAILSVHHPNILEFISAKVGAHTRGESWKFNISIDVSSKFMKSLRCNSTYSLFNGKSMYAKDVLKKIIEAAHESADPGMIFLERMNTDNPTPALGKYVSTAPCGDVGLSPGESCQFGYINLGNLVKANSIIDYQKLKRITHLMTRVLDNSIELSLDKYAHSKNAKIMRSKRKIGIGICGVADILIKLGIPYDSDDGRKTIRDITEYINFESKQASYELALIRGSFEAMKLKKGNRYFDEIGFLERKYASTHKPFINSTKWKNFSDKIKRTKRLRNASTTAIPPTGRSGLVIDASTGIEPPFSLVDHEGNVYPQLMEDLKELHRKKKINKEQHVQAFNTVKRTGSLKGINYLPHNFVRIYKTALEIAPMDHLKMVAAVQPVIDEAVSKTVNMPQNASNNNIMYIYLKAYELGLKGITVYRQGISKKQPRKLS